VPVASATPTTEKTRIWIVEERRDCERDSDHDDFVADRERVTGEPRADAPLDRMTCERRPEERQRRHEEEGVPGSDRA
jgi:hypothetical protein